MHRRQNALERKKLTLFETHFLIHACRNGPWGAVPSSTHLKSANSQRAVCGLRGRQSTYRTPSVRREDFCIYVSGISRFTVIYLKLISQCAESESFSITRFHHFQSLNACPRWCMHLLASNALSLSLSVCRNVSLSFWLSVFSSHVRLEQLQNTRARVCLMLEVDCRLQQTATDSLNVVVNSEDDCDGSICQICQRHALCFKEKKKSSTSKG